MQSAREEIRDLERVRYVAENYEYLQGLTRIPVGLMSLVVYLLVVFTGFEITTKFVADIVLTLALLVGVVLIVGFFGIRRYYENRYGRVRVIPRIFRRRRIYGGLVAFIIFLILFGLGFLTSAANVWEPYPLFLVFMDVTEVIDRWPERVIRPHYFIIGVLMAIAGSILWTMEVSQVGYPEDIFLHLLAAVLILYLVVGGIVDHLLLVRTMKSLPEEDDGRAV